MSYVKQKGLTVKDLVTTGIFSALYLVFYMVGGMFFALNPVLTFYMPIATALVCGPIYLLFVAKVQKRFSVSILGILMGVLMFVTGMHWSFALAFILLGFLADLLAGSGAYKKKGLNMLSYMLFSFSGTASYLVFFANPEGWAQNMLSNGTDQAYIDTMMSTGSTTVLIVMLVGTVIAGAASAFIGSKLLKKQFEKAGITA